jgi:hypothetical protein
MNITKAKGLTPGSFQFYMGGLYIIHITEEEYKELSSLGKSHVNELGNTLTPFSSLPIEVAETLKGRIMNVHGYIKLLRREALLLEELGKIQSKIKSLEY